MEQVAEVPVVQTLRDTEGELIQESHWASRWKGYINTYRRQKVGLRALQLYVAVIHTYGRRCPHHLLNGAAWMSARGINTVSVALGASDTGHIVSTWLGSCHRLTRLYSDVVWPCLDFTWIITYSCAAALYAAPNAGHKDFSHSIPIKNGNI